jgi:uncharacterized radical SAM superfamily protein
MSAGSGQIQASGRYRSFMADIYGLSAVVVDYRRSVWIIHEIQIHVCTTLTVMNEYQRVEQTVKIIVNTVKEKW